MTYHVVVPSKRIWSFYPRGTLHFLCIFEILVVRLEPWGSTAYPLS